MTPDELATAFALIGKAQMRSDAFAQKAAQTGANPAARALRALAASQCVQSRRFQMLMRGKIGDDAANLDEAFGWGLDELRAGLEALLMASVDGGRQSAARVLEQTLKVLDSAGAIVPGSETEAGEIWVCGICGHIAGGELPERCPVCGAVKSKFEAVE